MQHAGVTLKISKCEWFADSVKYLGHIVRTCTLEMDHATMASLGKTKHSRTQPELCAFLGLCNVYRRFVEPYYRIAAPFNQLLKKYQPAKFLPITAEQDAAFCKFITLIAEPPVLALLRNMFTYSVDTDSSNFQVESSLFQTHLNGRRKPIGY